jgi:hypothetical protein
MAWASQSTMSGKLQPGAGSTFDDVLGVPAALIRANMKMPSLPLK